MNLPDLELQIDAQDGNVLYQRTAAFAYLMALKHGIGAVVLRQGYFEKRADGSVATVILYMPYTDDEGVFPPETLSMLNEYDPALEYVLMTVSREGKGSCMVFSASRIGATPAICALCGCGMNIIFHGFRASCSSSRNRCRR